MLLEINQAIFGYQNRRVVQVEQLHLHAGQCLGIFGPNGAGKTTLVRGMLGLLKPLGGQVTYSGALRFGYLPQHRALDLNWPMTGFDAAAMAITARKRFGWIGKDSQRINTAMKAMNVSDLSRRPFSKLSGGQQQRLLLAGAIATDPQVLFLDEPTDGLDVRSRQTLLESLRQEIQHGLCMIMISHEVEDLLALADQIAWLHRGDDLQQPSRVELINPDQLSERVMRNRQVPS